MGRAQCWSGTASIIIKQALRTAELALAPLSDAVYIQRVLKAQCILFINAGIYQINTKSKTDHILQRLTKNTYIKAQSY